MSLLSDWPGVQDYVNYEVWLMNAVLPSRGRNCRRRPPLLVYPEARTPRRYYSLGEELDIFQLERVETYLATGRWLRRISSERQFRFQSELITLRKIQLPQQIIVVAFSAQTRHFEVRLVSPMRCCSLSDRTGSLCAF